MYINSVIKTQNDLDERDAYLNGIPAIAALDTLALQKPVTFFVGENGSGKSTLLEAIAVNFGFNPEGGSRNFNFHSVETHSGLHSLLRLSKGVMRPKDGFFLRAESFYNVATEVDRLDDDPTDSFLDSYGGKSLHAQSHGESFLSLMLSRFRGNGLYLLDEPEAALSPSRQMTLLARMHSLVQDGSQFIIATHSPMLMAYPDAQILQLDDGIKPVDYKQTEHYQITRSFLEAPERMLRILFED
jgi:predicted ATPase